MKICTNKPLYDIEKWIKHYKKHIVKEEGLSENTLSLYTRVLDKFTGYIDTQETIGELTSIKDIDALFISQFISSMEHQHGMKIKDDNFSYSHATRSLYIIALKTLFDFIEDRGEYENDGTRFSFAYEFKKLTKKRRGRKSKSQRKVKHLTHDEVTNLVHYLDMMVENRGRHYDYVHSLAIKLMLFGGLRASEVIGIRSDDITFITASNGVEIVEIRLSETKSGLEQYIPIKLEHIKHELEYILKDGENEYVVCNKKGESTVNRSNLYSAVKRIYQEAGIKKKGLHILRHTSAMMLLDKTGDITYVQELLRHSNITTTMIYVNRSVKQLGERVV